MNLVKTCLVLHGEVVTGLKQIVKKQLPKILWKTNVPKNVTIYIGKHLC